jgi:ADP-ribose pyrophosphatase YjhB (NUDIX family)
MILQNYKKDGKIIPCVVLFNDTSVKQPKTYIPGMFSIPVGGVTENTTVAQSAAKELREETCGLSAISSNIIAKQPYVNFETQDPYCEKGSLIRGYCVLLAALSRTDYDNNHKKLDDNKAPHEWLETNKMTRFSTDVIIKHINLKKTNGEKIESASLIDLDGTMQYVAGRTLRCFDGLNEAGTINKVLRGPQLDTINEHFGAIIENERRDRQFLIGTKAEVIM